jgi:endonuclease/exonuclease/phosphatase (EEP) superfamily protein YafD
MADGTSQPGERSRSWRFLVAALLVVAAFGVWVFAWFLLGAWQGVLALAPLLAAASGLVLLPAILLVTTRSRRIVVAVTCAVLLLPAIPLVRLVAHQAPLPADSIRLLEWNAQDYPQGVAVLEGLTARQAPDLVVVSQVEQEALQSSAELGARYPYVADSGNPWSADYVALLSRFPISSEHTDVRPVDGPDLRALVAEVSLPDGTLTVVAAHPTRPLLARGRAYGATRDQQLEQLGEVVRSLKVEGGSPLLVTGDFNVTTREAVYGRLLDATALVDAVDLPRWAAAGTWRPTRRAVPGVLPLDHVLHSTCLQPTGQVVLWRTRGSQHAPLVVTLRDAC